ncbi:small GTPase [Naegleria gruberi]|uniref:Small GTPase n=1 Tax=Naegleria gruberi TaxID=5762 RepID=D2V9Y2_NAEGR|nr:small GTPase [Naegleria gruberi]EFC46332.1 small GTPase [Naegleria gruberi]|eukprot:XP_002679076.1 small GTPase [Naegleria gruberi]
MVKLRCKVGILGDSTVGKTSLIKMFKERTFPNQYLMTIGADLYTKTIDVPVENQVELFIFDISGSSIYEKSYNEYIDGLNAFIIVYDATNPETFTNLTKWYRLCKSVRTSNSSQKKHDKSLLGVLVGNKSDLGAFEKVTRHQGEEFARECGLEFFQTATNTDDGNVEQPFLHIADSFYKSFLERVEEIKYVCEHKTAHKL